MAMRTSAQTIATLLLELVHKHPIRDVHVATDALEPPELAFVVHFPILAIPLRGQYEVELELDGNVAVVATKPGEVVLSPPNCWTKPSWRPPLDAIHLSFGRQHVGASHVVSRRGGEEEVSAEKASVPRSFGSPAQKTLDAILETIRYDRSSRAIAHLVNGLLICIANELNNPRDEHMGRAQKLFQDICTYIQHNYHEPLTRDSVAAKYRISPNHVSRVFNSEGHTRFTDYLTTVRVDRAKFLLQRYPLTVNEVAVRCGFSEVGYFCRVFKRVTSQTPSEFRNALTEREVQVAG
jgi:AraC-like DNA-binding protein